MRYDARDGLFRHSGGFRYDYDRLFRRSSRFERPHYSRPRGGEYARSFHDLPEARYGYASGDRMDSYGRGPGREWGGRPGTEPTDRPRGRPARRDDEELRAAVRRAFHEDRSLDAGAIGIEVEDGVVTLSGEVADHLEVRYAWDDAWETEGVRGVVSRIEVRDAVPAGEEAG